MDTSLNKLAEFYQNNTINLRPLISTHYGISYPQNGGRIVTTDPVTRHITLCVHRHPSLITLRSACDDPSGGRRPAQIPQLDTPHASKEAHNSIHNRGDNTDICQSRT